MQERPELKKANGRGSEVFFVSLKATNPLKNIQFPASCVRGNAFPGSFRFELEPGKTFGLMGPPQGEGKSTLEELLQLERAHQRVLSFLTEIRFPE